MKKKKACFCTELFGKYGKIYVISFVIIIIGLLSILFT